MQKTPTLGLIKPSQEDHYNIDDFNTNADIIDSQIHAKLGNIPAEVILYITAPETLTPEQRANIESNDDFMAIVNDSIATQAEAEAGTLTRIRNWTPQRIWQAIRNLARNGLSTGLSITDTAELSADATIVQNLGRARQRINTTFAHADHALNTAVNANNNANLREPAFNVLPIHKGGTGSGAAAFAGDRGDINLGDRAGQIMLDGTWAACGISFHRAGQFGSNFGLAADNELRYGGWSMGGLQHLMWHSGNFGRPQAHEGVGQWIILVANSNESIHMPWGGTWAFWSVSFRQSTGIFIGSGGGLLPGGGLISPATPDRRIRGFAWRIM